jgi:hypothetical protein
VTTGHDAKTITAQRRPPQASATDRNHARFDADAGRSLRIDGLAPGDYRVGAIRPLGVLRMPPRLTRVPGTLVIGGASPAVEPPPP